MQDLRLLLAGILLGFLATVLLAFLLPRKWGHLRAVLAALVGFLITLAFAYWPQ